MYASRIVEARSCIVALGSQYIVDILSMCF